MPSGAGHGCAALIWSFVLLIEFLPAFAPPGWRGYNGMQTEPRLFHNLAK